MKRPRFLLLKKIFFHAGRLYESAVSPAAFMFYFVVVLSSRREDAATPKKRSLEGFYGGWKSS